MTTYKVLVYEGWGKTFLVDADSAEEAEAIYNKGENSFPMDSEQCNETFVAEVSE